MNLDAICLWCFVVFIMEIFVLFPLSDFSIFNPIRNYNQWCNLNWFGIWFFTIILNIVFLPYAIGYWTYKLFTIDRK